MQKLEAENHEAGKRLEEVVKKGGGLLLRQLNDLPQNDTMKLNPFATNNIVLQNNQFGARSFGTILS